MKSASEYTPDIGLPASKSITTALGTTIFGLASAVQYGNANLSAFGFNVSDAIGSTLTSIGAVDISLGLVLSLASIMAVYLGNNKDIMDFSNHQSSLGIGLGVSVLLIGLSSDVAQTLSSNSSLALAVFAGQLIAFTSMAEYSDIRGAIGR